MNVFRLVKKFKIKNKLERKNKDKIYSIDSSVLKFVNIFFLIKSPVIRK